ncbi:hypothetical protein DL89DRAFT_268412, partial [Linderina pennispora]
IPLRHLHRIHRLVVQRTTCPITAPSFPLAHTFAYFIHILSQTIPSMLQAVFGTWYPATGT